MIKFFRQIRRSLISQNQMGKYFKYAIGEILLVVIGILIALQLNNWNESRKKEEQFKSTLEQLYNKITDDVWFYNFMIRENENIIATIDMLLNVNENAKLSYTVPASIWYTSIRSKNEVYSSAQPFLENLEYDSEDPKQKKLVNHLFNYNELIIIKIKYSFIQNTITEMRDELLKNNIAFPNFDHNKINLGWVSDSLWYSKSDILKTKELLLSNHFRSLLKSSKSTRSFDILDYRALLEESESILNLIRAYHPGVKLVFEDVGIIGTSINGFDDVGAKSTPMMLTDEEQSIWEIELFLKKGAVKFRCRDSWAINWGGESFPKGNAVREGIDIQVQEAGNYRVILDLSKNTYEFIKLDEDD